MTIDSIIVERDGSSWCAKFQDFVNLQESEAGFGDSWKEAVTDLLKQVKWLCQKAMWWGDGRPTFCFDRCFRNQEGELRCIHHGGPTLEEAVVIEMGRIA